MADDELSYSQQPNAGPVQVKKRGAGFWIATILAAFFFLCSVFLFLVVVALMMIMPSHVTRGEQEFVERVIERGSDTRKILVLPVKGMILERRSTGLFYMPGPGMVETVKRQIKQARADKNIKALLLDIDSPGGGITASDIIYNEIVKYKKETRNKVVVCMNDTAASGAYYISASADWIVAHPTTITGSIGVIMPLFNYEGLYEKVGLKDNDIKSGPLKDIGSPTRPMTPQERAILQGIIDEMHKRFVSIIAKGRNMTVEEVAKLADGRIYTGPQALKNKLIDQIGYFEDAIKKTKELANLGNAKVVSYHRPPGLMDLLRSVSQHSPSASTITIDIKDLLYGLRESQGNLPRMMYLWTGR